MESPRPDGLISAEELLSRAHYVATRPSVPSTPAIALSVLLLILTAVVVVWASAGPPPPSAALPARPTEAPSAEVSFDSLPIQPRDVVCYSHGREIYCGRGVVLNLESSGIEVTEPEKGQRVGIVSAACVTRQGL